MIPGGDDPPVYPEDLVDAFTLPNHRRVRIRPLRRCEDGAARELYGRLSPRTRYLRFFSPMPALPDSLVRLLTHVDYRRRLALLAEVDRGDGVQVVGLGNFAAIDDDSAEVGLVVCDEWQRQGIGVALAARVLRAADARGFRRFVAQTFWDNTVIRRLLERVGEIVSSRTRQGVSEITFVRRTPWLPIPRCR